MTGKKFCFNCGGNCAILFKESIISTETIMHADRLPYAVKCLTVAYRKDLSGRKESCIDLPCATTIRQTRIT